MDNRLPAGLRGRVIFGKGNEVTIGDRIRRIRKKRRLTQAELAMMSGLSLSAIQGYEQGRYEPKRKSLESIAEVFKIPVYELCDTPAQHGTNLAEVGTDCISRQQAIDAIEAEKIKHGNYLTSSYVGYEMAEKVVKQLSPIQPTEPKRGRWIEDKGQQTLMQNFIEKGEVWRVCSVCGAGHMIGHKYECDKAYHETHHNFCPNCGAKMEE